MVPPRQLPEDADRAVSTRTPLSTDVYRPHKRRKLQGCTQRTPSNVDPEALDNLTVCQAGSRTISYVRNGSLTYPRSTYQGWIPPMPPIPENVAISELKVSETNTHRLLYPS